MRYQYCKECCFLRNGKCVRSGPTVDIIYRVRKQGKGNKSNKKCSNFKLRIRRV